MKFNLLARLSHLCVVMALFFSSPDAQARDRWSEAEAKEWYDAQPWLVGANFVPSTAINQLEMWQADTFDPKTIDKELGFAAAIGMNTMRVFLHELAWEQDPKGFKRRVEKYLSIADRHSIRTMLVFFDGCWNPNPKAGKQPDPVLGVHNSGWVQSPGWEVLKDPSSWGRLEKYITDIVTTFANDKRVLAWDVYNEPECRRKFLPMVNAGIKKLLPLAFQWTRNADPSQPITGGLFYGPYAPIEEVSTVNKILLENSDINSFHNYDWPQEFEQEVKLLQTYGRPVITTEYMARNVGSTFDNILPIAKRHNVGAINWGLVDGKTQTKYPWGHLPCSFYSVLTDVNGAYLSLREECEPSVWFSDIFNKDGSPHRQAEIDLIKQLTNLPKGEAQ